MTGHLATITSEDVHLLLELYFEGRTDQLYFATKDISSTYVTKYAWLAGPQAGQLFNYRENLGPIFPNLNGDAKCATIDFHQRQHVTDSFTQVPCDEAFGLLVEIECPGGYILTPNGCLGLNPCFELQYDRIWLNLICHQSLDFTTLTGPITTTTAWEISLGEIRLLGPTHIRSSAAKDISQPLQALMNWP